MKVDPRKHRLVTPRAGGDSGSDDPVRLADAGLPRSGSVGGDGTALYPGAVQDGGGIFRGPGGDHGSPYPGLTMEYGAYRPSHGSDGGHFTPGVHGNEGGYFIRGVSTDHGLLLPGNPGDGGVLHQDLNSDGGAYYVPSRSGDGGTYYEGPTAEHGTPTPLGGSEFIAIRQQVGPDAVQPMYLTIDATGRVGAEFAGHISAAGVDLPSDLEQVNSPDTFVKWFHPTDASEQARIGGGFLTPDGLAYLILTANAAIAGQKGRGYLKTVASGPNKDSGIESFSHSLTLAGAVIAKAGAAGLGGSTFSKTIIDGLERSNFLQLLINAKRVVNFGSSTHTWGGTSRFSSAKTTAHGLGVTPSMVILQSESGYLLSTFNIGSVNFDSYATWYDNVGAGATDNFKWMAIS